MPLRKTPCFPSRASTSGQRRGCRLQDKHGKCSSGLNAYSQADSRATVTCIPLEEKRKSEERQNSTGSLRSFQGGVIICNNNLLNWNIAASSVRGHLPALPRPTGLSAEQEKCSSSQRSSRVGRGKTAEHPPVLGSGQCA